MRRLQSNADVRTSSAAYPIRARATELRFFIAHAIRCAPRAPQIDSIGAASRSAEIPRCLAPDTQSGTRAIQSNLIAAIYSTEQDN